MKTTFPMCGSPEKNRNTLAGPPGFLSGTGPVLFLLLGLTLLPSTAREIPVVTPAKAGLSEAKLIVVTFEQIMPYQWDTEFGVKRILYDAVRK